VAIQDGKVKIIVQGVSGEEGGEDDSDVVQADIVVGNTVVHIVDKVLSPASLRIAASGETESESEDSSSGSGSESGSGDSEAEASSEAESEASGEAEAESNASSSAVAGSEVSQAG
jgi:hypothetical protein